MSVRPHPPTPIPHPVPVLHIIDITKVGHGVLWLGFVVFLLATLVLAVLAMRKDIKHRALHIIMLYVAVISTLSYYAMATHGGVSHVIYRVGIFRGIETIHIHPFFWARYVDWALTAPLILFALALLTGMPWIDVLLLVCASEVSVLTTAFAGFYPNSGAKWGWYFFSCVFLILVFVSLLHTGRKYAAHQRNSHHYTRLAVYTVVVWIIYPVIFALGDVTGILNPDATVIAYTVLDIFAKAVFGLWLVFSQPDGHGWRGARFSEHWTEGRGSEGGIHLPGGD